MANRVKNNKDAAHEALIHEFIMKESMDQKLGASYKGILSSIEYLFR